MTPATSETHESPTSRDVLEQLTAVAERVVFPSVEAQAANLFRLVPSLLQIDFRELEIARATPSSLFQVHAIFTQIEMQGRLIIAEADRLIAVVSSHLATLASSAEVPARMVGIGRSWLQQADRLNEMIATAQRLADQPQWQGKASEAHLAVLPRQIEAMQQLRDLAETAAESVLLVGAIQNNIFDACALIFAEASEQVVGHVSAAPTAFFSHAASVVSLLVRVDALLAQWISGEGTWQPSADQIAAGLTKTSGAGFSWPKAVSQPGGGQESNSGADSEGGWKTTITEEGIKVQVPATPLEPTPEDGKAPGKGAPSEPGSESGKEESGSKGKGPDKGAVGDEGDPAAKVTGKPGGDGAGGGGAPPAIEPEPPHSEPQGGEAGVAGPDPDPEIAPPAGAVDGESPVPDAPAEGEAADEPAEPVAVDESAEPGESEETGVAGGSADVESSGTDAESPGTDAESPGTGAESPGADAEGGDFEAVTPESAAEALGLGGESEPGAAPSVESGEPGTEASVDPAGAKQVPVDGQPSDVGSGAVAPADPVAQGPSTPPVPDLPAEAAGQPSSVDPAQSAVSGDPSPGGSQAVADPAPAPPVPAQTAPAGPAAPGQPSGAVQPGQPTQAPSAQAPAAQGSEGQAPVPPAPEARAQAAAPASPVVEPSSSAPETREPAQPVSEELVTPAQPLVEDPARPAVVPEPGVDEAASQRSADIDRGATAWDRLTAAR